MKGVGWGWPRVPAEGPAFGGNIPEEALLISTSCAFITRKGRQVRA